MKAVYFFQGNSHKRHWPAFYKDWKYLKQEKDDGNIHLEYLSLCHKQELIETVVKTRAVSRNWVAQRVTQIDNEELIKIAKENMGFVIVRVNEGKDVGKIVSRIPLLNKPKKEFVQKREKKKGINQTFSSLFTEGRQLKEKISGLGGNFKFPEIDPKVFEVHKIEAFKRFIEAGVKEPTFTDGWNSCYEFLRRQVELSED